MPGTARERRSDSTEDHLERIQELVDRKGYARVADIAVALKLTRSTVSNMVRRLATRGFVNYERYRGFTLTRAGRTVAADIRARHRILAELLALMGLDEETVAREVEDIEHHLQPETLAAFNSLTSYWRARPAEHAAYLAYTSRQRKAGRHGPR